MIPVVIWPWLYRPKEDIFVTSFFFFMATKIQLGKAIIQLRRLKWKFRRKVTPFFSYERDPLFRLKVIPWS